MKEYPDSLDLRCALEMVLASCQRLQADMGGIPATKNCTGLLTTWDNRIPTVYYLERNMRWAQEVLDRPDPVI